MERESATLLDLDAFKNVRNELVIRVIAHQPRVAEDHHQPHILIPSHESAQLPTIAPGRPLGVQIGEDPGVSRQALAERRQRFPAHAMRQKGRLDSDWLGVAHRRYRQDTPEENCRSMRRHGLSPVCVRLCAGFVLCNGR